MVPDSQGSGESVLHLKSGLTFYNAQAISNSYFSYSFGFSYAYVIDPTNERKMTLNTLTNGIGMSFLIVHSQLMLVPVEPTFWGVSYPIQ
jgi:hypothetical protein